MLFSPSAADSAAAFHRVRIALPLEPASLSEAVSSSNMHAHDVANKVTNTRMANKVTKHSRFRC
jgi:hypothetical protein